jgi:hypothetical protein
MPFLATTWIQAETATPQDSIGAVPLAFAERDADGAYQLSGDTAQALVHYERAEQEMRNARKHSETPQIKDARGRTLKQILERHAALLDQMGHTDQAAALRREASEI